MSPAITDRHHLIGIATALTLGLTATSAQATDLREVYERSRIYDSTISDSFESSQSPNRIPSQNDEYVSGSISLTLTQTLYNRANKKLIDQARIGILQADSQFVAVEQQLILRVATAYFNVLRAKANVDFSRSELEAIGRQRVNSPLLRRP